jgi:hypothetical protein
MRFFDDRNEKLDEAFASGPTTEWLLLSGGANVSPLSNSRNSARRTATQHREKRCVLTANSKN